jgi:hypothetical protein
MPQLLPTQGADGEQHLRKERKGRKGREGRREERGETAGEESRYVCNPKHPQSFSSFSRRNGLALLSLLTGGGDQDGGFGARASNSLANCDPENGLRGQEARSGWLAGLAWHGFYGNRLQGPCISYTSRSLSWPFLAFPGLSSPAGLGAVGLRTIWTRL